MNKILYIFLVLCLPFTGNAQNSFVNGLNPENGCKILERPASQRYNPNQYEDISMYTPESLIDEREKSIWSSMEESKYPYVFVFQMAEDFKVQSLVFDNRVELDDESAVKRVKVEFSDQGPDKGFDEVLDIKLNPNESNSVRFDDHKVRWIRLTILSNHGSKEHVQLKHFQAWGEFVKVRTGSRDIEGTWNSNWGWVSFHTSASGNVTGCYEFEGGEIVSGAFFEGRRLDFKWRETSINNSGWATITLNEEGTNLYGTWGKGEHKTYFGAWDMTKVSDTPKACALKVEEDTPKVDEEPFEIPDIYTLNLTVSQEKNGMPVEGAQIKITGENDSSHLYEAVTDASGNINVRLEEDNYTISIIKEGFQDLKESLTYLKINKKEPGSKGIWKSKYSLERFKVGDNFQLKSVQFERGKSQLLESSYESLDKLVTLLKEHPTMRIQLQGHTDNQGSQRINKILSEQRVKSVKDYLVKEGIKAKRISGIGYGGLKPIADNSDPELRKNNRRVEVVITNL